MKYFTSSFVVTVIGLILGFLWGAKLGISAGFTSLLIVAILAVLEVSLSFDNAVVNAIRLETMSSLWRQRFITWGMLIAVFGMRLVFPIVIVAAFTGIGIFDVTRIAFTNPNQYAEYLHGTHAPISAFGAMFLLMIFLSFIFDQAKEIHWIALVEEKLVQMGKLVGVEVIIALSVLYATQHFIPTAVKLPVVLAGICGLLLYLLVDGLSNWLEGQAENGSEEEAKEVANVLTTGKALVETVKQGGLISFLYLELIDASFSFDGVMGAFALSKDIVIISLGLAIGAMFVRSLTIMLVEKKTLQEYIFLEHGAHWAIGALALIMFISISLPVPEVITGLIGVAFIGVAFLSSLKHRRVSSSLEASTIALEKGGTEL